MGLESKWVLLLTLLLWRTCSASSSLGLPRRTKGHRRRQPAVNYRVAATCSISLIGENSSQASDPLIHAKVECDSKVLYNKTQSASEIAKMKEAVKFKNGIELFHRTKEGFAYIYVGGSGRFDFHDSTFKNLPPIPNVDTLAPMMAQGSRVTITDTVFEGNKGFKVAGALYATAPRSSRAVLEILDSTISDNSGDAGAISMDSGDLSATTVKILRNEGEFSGAVRARGTGLVTIEDCTFEGIGTPPKFLGYVRGDTDELPKGIVPQVGAFSAEDRLVCVIRYSNFTDHGSFSGTIMTNGHVTLTIDGCNFESNVAASGGAVHVNGDTGNDAQLWWSTFKGNSARNGGAVTILGKGLLYVSSSTFQENHAHTGGAFFGDFSEPESTNMIDCERASQGTRIDMDYVTFLNNSAQSSGGAIFGRCTQILLDTNVFADNHAGGHGGGIFLDHGFQLDTPKCVYHRNRGNIGGGAIFANNSELLELEQCSLVGNRAGSEGGGAIHVVGVESVNITQTNFSENAAVGSGGAIFLQTAGEVNVERALIRGNQAGGNGGGAALESTQNAQVLQSDFHNNTAELSGGAIASMEAGALSVEDCALVLNQALTENGGAIFASQVGNFSLSKTDHESLRAFKTDLQSGSKGSSALKNSAGGIGGAVFISNTTTAVIDTMNIMNNGAEEGGAVGGGGLKSFHIIDSHIEANDAKIGGGLSLSGLKFMEVQGSVVQNNNAENFGGGALLRDVAEIHLSGGSLAGNTAQLGAGLYMSGKTALTASAILFNRNEASEAGGAVSCGDESEIRMEQSTFDYNYAPSAGSISAKCSCNVTARHCSFHRDKKRKDNGDFFKSARDCSRIDSEHCKFWGGKRKINLLWMIVIICASAVVLSLAAGVGRACCIAHKKKAKARAKKQEEAGLISDDESDLDEYDYYTSSDDYSPDGRPGRHHHGGRAGPSSYPIPYVFIVDNKSGDTQVISLNDASVHPVKIQSQPALTYEGGSSKEAPADNPVEDLTAQLASPENSCKSASGSRTCDSRPVELPDAGESVLPRGLVSPEDMADPEFVANAGDLATSEVIPSPKALASLEGVVSTEAVSSVKKLASPEELTRTEESISAEQVVVRNEEAESAGETATSETLLGAGKVAVQTFSDQ